MQKAQADPSVDTITNVFGSWNDALEQAGLDIQPDQYTEEECIEALRYIAKELGRSPTVREYRTHRRPTDPSLRSISGRSCLPGVRHRIRGPLREV